MLLTYSHALFAVLVFLGMAVLLSENKKRINYKVVLLGLLYQVLLTVIFFKWPFIAESFGAVNKVLQAISESTTKATTFVFGGLANPPSNLNLGFILAIQGFPILIVISALCAILTYWGVLPFIINCLSFVFKKTLKIGGTLGLAVAANIFAGMSETPLVITPYLKRLTHSELFSLMTCGTAAVSSSVMVLYSIIMNPIIDNSICHILSAVLISVPASLTMSRIIVPELDNFTEGKNTDFTKAKSTLDAVYTGIMDGGKVIITIIAMLIGFISLIDVLNQFLAFLTPASIEALTIQKILGWLMYPITWLMGIPNNELHIAGSLLGTKIVLNEIIAFQELAAMNAFISYKTKIMMIYSLCNFANLGSIGVMIGVYSTLIPERRQEVIKLGIKAVIAGTLANIITATIVGVLH